MTRPVVAAGRVLGAARESMTPEQRWTAGVALLLTLAVLLFGHPGLPVVLRRSAPPASAGAPVAGEEASDAAGRAAPPLSPERSVAPQPLWGAGMVTAVHDDAVAGGPTEVADPPAPAGAPAPLRVVALAVPGGVPGRDDAAAAGAFLPGVEVVVVDPAEPGACERVTGSADVAVAGFGVDDGLRRCLAEGGVVVVAFDALGSLDSGAGAVLSTRRGLVDALSDAVRWGVAGGALRGRVAVVGAAPARRRIQAALPGWRRAGLDVVATAFVDDAAAGPPTDEVRRVAAEDVDVVLFAVPARAASHWATRHLLLDRDVRFVVGDAFDAVWSESLLPVLDGALALTSMRVPWFSREFGETEAQTDCRERWEAHVAPATLLPGEETVRVYAWCQHAVLLEGLSSTAALAERSLRSPLTSDLGPLAGGGWGPRHDAVLAWRAVCGCWESVEPFTERR